MERLLPLLLLLNACLGPTYPADGLEQSVRDLCRREHGLVVDARRSGATLYVTKDLEGMVGEGLEFDRSSLEKLERIMMSGTRVSLSTDARVDFLVVRARDARLGSTLTLLRHVPDIKGLFHMRYSRSDFENRLVIEMGLLDESSNDPFPDVTLNDFMARLAASRLQRQLTGNPLVSVVLGVRGVRGDVTEGVLTLRLDRMEGPAVDALAGRVLERAALESMGYVLKRYDPSGDRVQWVRLADTGDAELWRRPAGEVMSESGREKV